MSLVVEMERSSRGNGGTSGATPRVWACPFGNGGSITVGHQGRQVLINAQVDVVEETLVVIFGYPRPGEARNYDREDFGQGGYAYASFNNEPNPNIGGRRGITFDNGNTSGRTQVRQYTAYFCSNSEVS